MYEYFIVDDFVIFDFFENVKILIGVLVVVMLIVIIIFVYFSCFICWKMKEF